MNWDYIISKEDKDKVYKMIFEKHMVLHGGVIGDYNNTHYVVTLLPDWVKYLDEYGIKAEKRTQEDYEEYINMRGRYSSGTETK